MKKIVKVATALIFAQLGFSQIVAFQKLADGTPHRLITGCGDGSVAVLDSVGRSIKRFDLNGKLTQEIPESKFGGRSLTAEGAFAPVQTIDIACNKTEMYVLTYARDFPGVSPYTFQALSKVSLAGEVTLLYKPAQLVQLTIPSGETITRSLHFSAGVLWANKLVIIGYLSTSPTITTDRTFSIMELRNGELFLSFSGIGFDADLPRLTNNTTWLPQGPLRSVNRNNWKLSAISRTNGSITPALPLVNFTNYDGTHGVGSNENSVVVATKTGSNFDLLTAKDAQPAQFTSLFSGAEFAGQQLSSIYDIQLSQDGTIIFLAEPSAGPKGVFSLKNGSRSLLATQTQLQGIPYSITESAGKWYVTVQQSSGQRFTWTLLQPNLVTKSLSGDPGKTSRFQCLDCGGRVTVKIGGNPFPALPVGNDQYEFAVPTTATSGAIIVEVANDAGSPVQFPLQLTITARPLAVATTTLPAGTASVNYKATLTVTGGTGPYSWSSAAGTNLPVGLTLRADGVLTGVPSIPGAYQIAATVKDSAGQTAQVQLTLVVAAYEPPPKISALVNAASGTQALAPGTYATVIGTNLSMDVMVPSKLPLPTTLAQTSMLVNGSPVILVYVSPGQINLLLPDNLPVGQPLSYKIVTVSASGKTLESDTGTVTLQANAPAAFQDTSRQNDAVNGEALYIPIVTDENYQIVGTPNAPALSGSVITLWMTGLGNTDVQVPYGMLSPSDPPAHCTASPIRLTFEDQDAPIAFCGLSPGSFRLFQLNFTVPTIGEGGDSKLRKGTLEIGSQKFSFSLFW